MEISAEVFLATKLKSSHLTKGGQEFSKMPVSISPNVSASRSKSTSESASVSMSLPIIIVSYTVALTLERHPELVSEDAGAGGAGVDDDRVVVLALVAQGLGQPIEPLCLPREQTWDKRNKTYSSLYDHCRSTFAATSS